MANINKGIPMIWFSGDKHLYHEFMIRGKMKCAKCSRPLRIPQDLDGTVTKCCGAAMVKQEDPPRPGFKDVYTMNRTIIDNHNDRVAKGDVVYELGDFALKCNAKDARDARYEMNGNFYFIEGNHDQIAVTIPDCWVWIRQLERIKPKGWETPHITLCHYAMRVWHGSHKGTWQLYGHSHGHLPEGPEWLSFDVGVDANNFAPISIEEVIKRMQPKIQAWEDWKKRLNKPGGVGF